MNIKNNSPIFQHIATYDGANEYYFDRAVVMKFTKSDDMLSKLSENIKKIQHILPKDFQVAAPTTKEGIECCASNLLVELLNYVRGNIRYCEVLRRDTGTFFACDYHNPNIVKYCFNFLTSILGGNCSITDLRNQISELLTQCKKGHPDYQASFLLAYAIKQNLYHSPLGGRRWLFGTGDASRIFFETSLVTDLKNNGINLDKLGCKKIFEAANVPSPKYVYATSEKQALQEVSQLEFPVVVKPVKGGKGNGVTANIQSTSHLKQAIRYALKHCSESPSIIIEEHVDGREYRFTCVNGSIIGVINREPPFIVGDGTKTVKQLISDINALRTPNLSRSKYLRPIKIDESVVAILDAQGFSFNDTVPNGKTVRVRENSNMSTGASYCIPKIVHSDVLKEVNEIISQVPVFSLGVDYLTTDISKSTKDARGGFIEINNTPGVAMLSAYGLDEPGIGEHFLKQCKNKKEVFIHLYNSNSQRFSPQCDLHAETIILPNFVLSNGKTRRIANAPSSKTLIDSFLANPKPHLNILVSDTIFLRSGLPIVPNSKIFIESDVSHRIDEILSNVGIAHHRLKA